MKPGQKKNIMPQALKEKLLEIMPYGDDEDAYLYEKEIELKQILSQNKNLKKEFLDKYNLGRLEAEDYFALINQMSSSSIKYNVHSIDKVKGLEAEECMFIVNKSMSDYLLMKKTGRNKELNYLYVALTRTSRNLILAINIEEGKNEIIDAIEKMGIKKYNYEI